MPNKIEAALEAAKLTKSELARRTGIHRVSIVRIVQGDAEPSLRNAIRIARELGTTVEEIFDTNAA